MGMLLQSLEQIHDQRAEEELKKFLMSFSFGLPEKQLLVFTQQLAVVLEAGIPLIEALFILEQQTTNPKLQKILADVRQEVINGKIFSEAMAQTGGILVLSSVEDPENYWTYFLGIESCKFRKMVLPGDTIIFKCELLAPIRRGIAKMKGEAYVGNNLVCEAIMTASITRKEL